MTIEHVNDRNSTNRVTTMTGGTSTTDMNDLQRTLVSEHIHDLQREGSALRAERARDERRARKGTATDTTDGSAGWPSRRIRLGRWLVGLGQAIAGPRPVPAGHDGEPLAAMRTVDDPGGDDARFARAA